MFPGHRATGFPMDFSIPLALVGEEWMSRLLVVAYFAILVTLAIYGVHRYWLVYLYFKNRDNLPPPPRCVDPLPEVTVQLPVFNERYVVERLIDAVCHLNYPSGKLRVQVLDDSTDETVSLVASKVAFHSARGVRIEHVRRSHRGGFKAGSLQRGLELIDSPLVAIFDADFVPEPDTLLKMVGFFSDPEVGMVQLRWEHLNRDYSLLTQAQAVLLDGHFVLESGARCRSGRFFNFNGTAGMWRRQTIEQAGGWQTDTLTEDLDLSYRAQLKGWRFVFLQDVTAPAEVPVDMNSFKAQQYRWAKGSMQTARKLLPEILRGDLPVRVKTESFFHLSANIAYPLMVALSLLMLPALQFRLRHASTQLALFDLPLFFAATLSVSSFYLVSQRELLPDWKKRLPYLPLAMALGIGLSVSNSRAVLEALLGISSPFNRTPKFGVVRGGDAWKAKRYRTKIGLLPIVEVLLGLHFVYLIVLSVSSGRYWSVPFLALFMTGYLATGLASLFHGLAPSDAKILASDSSL